MAGRDVRATWPPFQLRADHLHAGRAAVGTSHFFQPLFCSEQCSCLYIRSYAICTSRGRLCARERFLRGGGAVQFRSVPWPVYNTPNSYRFNPSNHLTLLWLACKVEAVHGHAARPARLSIWLGLGLGVNPNQRAQTPTSHHAACVRLESEHKARVTGLDGAAGHRHPFPPGP